VPGSGEAAARHVPVADKREVELVWNGKTNEVCNAVLPFQVIEHVNWSLLFLEDCDDIVSYTKNYSTVHFKIDYRDASGEIRDYYPDFIVKTSEKELYIVETKGREDLDDPLKIARLRQWCEDVNKSQSKMKCHCLYVRQEEYEKYPPKKFSDLIKIFLA